MKVIIVGGVAGGASAAARLRRLDENAQIIMFEKGEYISFANCGLPYYIGGTITQKSALTLQTPQSFNARFNVDVRINSEVVSIDRENQTVEIKHNGEIYEESYDKLILSMGAEPIKPRIEGLDSQKVFTLRNISDTYKITQYINESKPSSAVIVGGGFIGVEMAENLKSAGLSVSIVEMADQVIAPLDYDMACDVHNYIENMGIKLYLSNGLKKVEELEEGIKVHLNNGSIQAEMLILAIGVKPESAIAKESGILCNERGYVKVDSSMRTCDENIFAVGDMVEIVDFVTKQNTMVALAGPANKQGRIVAQSVCSLNSSYQGAQGSSVLKLFDMTVASTGINEKTAKKLGLNYEKSFTYSANHASYYPNAENMSMKIIFEKETGKILGAQIVGFDGVDKRCDVLATAIRFGATANDLTALDLCYAPPFSSAKDPVNMAGYVVENILEKMVNVYHWHDVSDLQKRDDVILLDVRTKTEFANCHIDKTINIPLDALRANLSALDKNKKIYVNCQSGLRSYIACRILTQKGFECYNLSGGYRLYNSIFKKSHVEVAVNTETQRIEKANVKSNSCNNSCGL